MDASLIALGAHAPDAALTLNRMALGALFAISGYLKLFNAARHATLAHTLPSVEFSGGCALRIGLLSALASLGLFVVCFGAFALRAQNSFTEARVTGHGTPIEENMA